MGRIRGIEGQAKAILATYKFIEYEEGRYHELPDLSKEELASYGIMMVAPNYINNQVKTRMPFHLE